VGDTSLLSASGLAGTCEGVRGNEVRLGSVEATGPPLKKNFADVVSVKSWPTNKSWKVRLFKFENVELDASCFQRTSLLALAALAGVNSQATSAMKRRVSFASLTPLQRAGNLVQSAILHAFHILKQLYECITPCCALQHKRTVSVGDAKPALEGRAEFGLDLPPLPLALASDQQQQQLQALHSRFVANTKKQLFLNTSSEAANAFQYTVRKFWREFEGGSVCAKTKAFSKKKGGFLLQDSLIVLLQAVVAARLVWYFRCRTQPASACASAAPAAAAVALAASSAPHPAAALAPAPIAGEEQRNFAKKDIGIHTGNPVASSTLQQLKLATGMPVSEAGSKSSLRSCSCRRSLCLKVPCPTLSTSEKRSITDMVAALLRLFQHRKAMLGAVQVQHLLQHHRLCQGASRRRRMHPTAQSSRLFPRA
jgi:hypothetical protein